MLDKSRRILERIAIASFIVGVVLAAMGVYLVYLGASGDTEFSFFGQKLRSTNAGIAAIFIGAALIVLNVRRTLTSFDKTIPPQSGKKAPGDLRITDIRVTQDEPPRSTKDLHPTKCLVDFWVSNDGGSQVIITAVDFEVIETARAELVKGPMESSETYNVDITDLREAGQHAHCPISQVIEPGESDRFTTRLIAAGLGLGVFAVWRLLPTLITNYGPIPGKIIVVWLPFPDPDTSLEDMKQIETMGKNHGIRR